MKKIIALVSLVSSLAVAAPNWVPIAESSDGKFSFAIDLESTYVVDGLLEFAIKADSPDKHNITNWKVDCESRNTEIVDIIYLNASGEVTGTDRGPMKVSSMPSGSVYDRIVTKVCSGLIKI